MDLSGKFTIEYLIKMLNEKYYGYLSNQNIFAMIFGHFNFKTQIENEHKHIEIIYQVIAKDLQFCSCKRHRNST